MSNNHSDVYLSELDLSQVIANVINSSGALVFASSQGPLGMQFMTNTKQFVSTYGAPNPQVSYAHYAALAFLQQANQLYSTRVVGAGAVYGGSVLQNLAVNSTSQFNYPLSVPSNFDPTQSINGSTNELQNLAYFYAIGPGSYASNVAVAVDSLNMLAPAGVTLANPTVVQELALTNFLLTAPTSVVTASLTNQPPTGAATINGIVLTTGQYVLLVSQTTAQQNGVWQVNTAGAWTQTSAVTALTTDLQQTWQLQPTGTYTWQQFVWVIGGVTVQNNDLCLFNGQTLSTQNGVYRYSSATQSWSLLATQPPSIVIGGKYLFNLTSGVYIQDTTFSGSTLGAGTFNYYITAVNSIGETLATMSTTTLASSGNINELSWNTVAKATSYKVYGRTTGSIGLLGTSTTPSFTDTGVLTPNTTMTYPTTYAGTNLFNVQVYDLTKNVGSPVEQFTVTLQANVNGYGQQTQMDLVVNDPTNGSNYVRVVNPAAAYSTVPLIFTTPKMPLSGGSSGAVVTDSTIIAGWQNYASKITVSVNILINGGYSTPAVQTAMDVIAQGRKDCTTVLDVPSSQQSSTAAVNYRVNTLNLNSNYSALYTPDVLITDTYNGMALLVPPSGYVAAQYAYADANASPAQSPAGLTYGVLPVNVVRTVYLEGDMDLLQANQINYIRQMPRQGFVIMEASTLQSSTSALSFVSVRRILNVVETATQQALMISLWALDDPNTETRIVSMINDYLESKKQAGQISDYNVVSNLSNNPLNDVNQGILHVDTYILPKLPIQRILLRTIITKQGITFQEAALLATA